MRPRELTVQGFRSYRGRTTFDFRGRRLVGVVGPIGAGKSTILDAVVFALYGKTPSFERDTRSLIHQLEDGCHVELLFEVFSQRYERGATLITSNLPFDEWTETFSSERLTGALLDRLTHHVSILEMNGDSYRLGQSRARKARVAANAQP